MCGQACIYVFRQENDKHRIQHSGSLFLRRAGGWTEKKHISET